MHLVAPAWQANLVPSTSTFMTAPEAMTTALVVQKKCPNLVISTLLQMSVAPANSLTVEFLPKPPPETEIIAPAELPTWGVISRRVGTVLTSPMVLIQ